MSRVRQTRTKPEDDVAILLRLHGQTYRRNVRTLPGAPDFSNKKRAWIVNVHGCFWHGHDCSRGKRPRHNADFWNPKLDRNKARDAAVESRLVNLGFRVLTIWECELRNQPALREKLSAFFERSTIGPALSS